MPRLTGAGSEALSPLHNPAVAEFEVATGAGFDVVHGVVGAFEVFAK